MNKIFLLLLISVALASCGVKQWEDTKQSEVPDASVEAPITSENQNIEVSNNESSSLVDSISSIPSVFLWNESFNSCVTHWVDECMSFVSDDQSVSLACDDYLSTLSKESCEDNETTQEAKSAKDASICEKMHNNKESCLLELALTLWEKDLDTTVCNTLEGDTKISCNNSLVAKKAIKMKDAAICKESLEYAEWDNYDMLSCEESVRYLEEGEGDTDLLKPSDKNEADESTDTVE